MPQQLRSALDRRHRHRRQEDQGGRPPASTPTTSASAARWACIRPRRGPVGYRCLATEVPDAIERLLRQYLVRARARREPPALLCSPLATRNYVSCWPAKFVAAVARDLPPRISSIPQEDSVTSLFPMFIKLAGKQVPGRRRWQSRRAEDRGPAGNRRAHPRRCSASRTPAVREWAREGRIELELRPFHASDLDGHFPRRCRDRLAHLERTGL